MKIFGFRSVVLQILLVFIICSFYSKAVPVNAESEYTAGSRSRNIERTNLATSPFSPPQYCWASGFVGPIPLSPAHHPGKFLYSPIDIEINGGNWTSNMDHEKPNYVADNKVSSLGSSVERMDDNTTTYYNKYFYYRSNGLEYGYDGHDGSDFSTNRLSNIAALAAADGTVTARNSACTGGWGCYIEITHDNGYLTKYSHLKSGSYLVNIGDRVVAGQKIATVGDTGSSKGIHLHFSVFHWNPNSERWINGQKISGGWEITDPWGWNPHDVYYDSSDPLFSCNGEISYNIWIGDHPTRKNTTPSAKPNLTAIAMGGWYDESDNSWICQPPINGQPNNVTISSDSTGKVTFNWQPSQCNGLDYYTFRIADHNDIDYEPWIIDHGISSSARSTSEEIPLQYKGKQLYWSIWAHGSSGYSLKGGPWAFIIDDTHPPLPPALSADYWSVNYFGSKELSNPCGNPEQFSQTFVFKNWQENSPSNGCPGDNWSARMSRNVYFPGGSYTFALEADDWARIYFDDALFVDHWGGATGHYEGYQIDAGYHTVKIEFADTSGTARVSAWWWGPGYEIPHDQKDNLQWHANYWPFDDQYWDPYVSVNIGSGNLSFDWATNLQPFGLPPDSFSAKFRRDIHFLCGTYKFNFDHDDGMTFLIDGIKLVDRWSGAIGQYSYVTDLSGGYHSIEINYRETGGYAHISFDFEALSNCAPPQPVLIAPGNSEAIPPDVPISLRWKSPPNSMLSMIEIIGDNGVDYSSDWIVGDEYELGRLWPGYYTWTVTAANEYGSSPASQTCSFQVIDPGDYPVNAEFDAWPQSGPAPLTVTFHIVDTANASSCFWDYGDGQTGYNCSPYHNHTYARQGNYSVTLIVSGVYSSAQSSRYRYINVLPEDGIYRSYLPLIQQSRLGFDQLKVYGDFADVELANDQCDWITCLDDPEADFVFDGQTFGTVSASKNNNGTFTIKKLFMYFDTSAIPDDAKIEAITFGIKSGPYLNGSPRVAIVKSLAAFPATYSDINQLLYGYSICMFVPIQETWQIKRVVPTETDWINKSGLTKFALIEMSEITRIAPSSTNDIVFYMAESEQNRPYLIIEYSK